MEVAVVEIWNLSACAATAALNLTRNFSLKDVYTLSALLCFVCVYFILEANSNNNNNLYSFHYIHMLPF